MCEFCHKHGEGKRWYLQARNYSEDLLSDLQRRKFIAEFFAHPETARRGEQRLSRLDRAPGFVQRAIRWRITHRMKQTHFGQVVPLEEVKRIFGFVTSIVRMACYCRQTTVGSEQRYCYGVSMAPQGGRMGEIIREIDASYLTGPTTSGLEALSQEEAIAAFKEHEQEGLCHTVWTFVAPFIGGICNCDRSDCMAMRFTVNHRVLIMFRSEFVAQVDEDLCHGCRSCMRVCQFGAIGYSAAQNKARIDPRQCYGCGVCRAVCPKDAIRLQERHTVPAAAALW